MFILTILYEKFKLKKPGCETRLGVRQDLPLGNKEENTVNMPLTMLYSFDSALFSDVMKRVIAPVGKHFGMNHVLINSSEFIHKQKIEELSNPSIANEILRVKY